ncbi:MAG: O-antigen ligase family protein [Planctomycetaceae bacterium]
MFHLISCVVIVAFFILVMKARSNSGVALGLAWSTFALEQVLQQAFPILWTHGAIVNVSIAAVITYSVLGAWLRKNQSLEVPDVPLLAMYLLLALTFLSYFWSAAPASTLQYLIKMAPYLLVFVVITPLCANESSSVSTAVKVTVFFGGLVIFNLLFSNFGRRSVVLELAGGQQVEGNPLAIADYASTVAICGVFILFGGQVRKLHALVISAVVVTSVYLVMRSHCRGQLIAVFASLLVWLPVTYRELRRRSFFLPSAAICFLCLAAVFFMQQNSMANRWESRFVTQAGQDRFVMVSSLLRQFQESDYWVWAVGLGNSSSFRLVGYYPHNVPVEVLCEEGLIGCLLLAAFVGGTLKMNIQLLRQRRIHRTARFNTGLLLALFTFHAILSLKQGSLIGSCFMLSFGACLTLAGRRYRASFDHPVMRDSKDSSRALVFQPISKRAA